MLHRRTTVIIFEAIKSLEEHYPTRLMKGAEVKWKSIHRLCNSIRDALFAGAGKMGTCKGSVPLMMAKRLAGSEHLQNDQTKLLGVSEMQRLALIESVPRQRHLVSQGLQMHMHIWHNPQKSYCSTIERCLWQHGCRMLDVECLCLFLSNAKSKNNGH